MKAEKLNLNVSSIGDWHIAPKTFQSQWNCTSYRKLFQKNFCISLPLTSTTGMEKGREKQMPQGIAAGSAPWDFGMQSIPKSSCYLQKWPFSYIVAPSALQATIKPEDRELTGKGETCFKLGTASFRQMEKGLGRGGKNEKSSRRQHLSGEFGAVWLL